MIGETDRETERRETVKRDGEIEIIRQRERSARKTGILRSAAAW